jgi:hypothetical protein
MSHWGPLGAEQTNPGAMPVICRDVHRPYAFLRPPGVLSGFPGSSLNLVSTIACLLGMKSGRIQMHILAGKWLTDTISEMIRFPASREQGSRLLTPVKVPLVLHGLCSTAPPSGQERPCWRDWRWSAVFLTVGSHPCDPLVGVFQAKGKKLPRQIVGVWRVWATERLGWLEHIASNKYNGGGERVPAFCRHLWNYRSDTPCIIMYAHSKIKLN